MQMKHLFATGAVLMFIAVINNSKSEGAPLACWMFIALVAGIVCLVKLEQK
jgi:hypothetical protein